MGERLNLIGDAIINLLGKPLGYQRETTPDKIIHVIKKGDWLDPDPGGFTGTGAEEKDGNVIIAQPRT